MTTPRDYYEVLGIGSSAQPDEIKSAFRKAALRWHPDRNPENKQEATAHFREATEAYGVLSDPQKRAAYDRFGHAGVANTGPSFSREDLDSIFGSSLEDILGAFGFDDLFGVGSSRGRRTRAHRGADLRYDLALSFAEAASGVQTKIKVPRLELCDLCGGSGAEAGSQPVPCQTCGGRGQVRYQQGFFTVMRTCPTCRGSGQQVKNPCHKCRGQGRMQRERTIDVRIPPGVDTHTRLRIPGEGEAGAMGGPAGDLYVVLEVAEHPFFERRNSDLYCTIPLNIAQATLGTEISVPVLNGHEKLRIPEGTQTGAMFRLRGKGLPDPHGGGKGDLYVNIRVLTPEKLTREQRKLFEQLTQVLEKENRPAERDSSFFEKVKDIFG